MYLIDTSVWIDYFRGKQTVATKKFSELLDLGSSFGLTGIIYQEILQGVGSDEQFQKLANYLSTQLFFTPIDSVLSFQEAAKIFFLCRKKGTTVRSTVDCLIAQIAIEHDLVLLHHDKDYLEIHKVVSDLKVFPSKASDLKSDTPKQIEKVMTHPVLDKA